MSNPIRYAVLRYAESRILYPDHFPHQPAELDSSRWDQFWQSLVQSLEYNAQCGRRPSVLRYFVQRDKQYSYFGLKATPRSVRASSRNSS